MQQQTKQAEAIFPPQGEVYLAGKRFNMGVSAYLNAQLRVSHRVMHDEFLRVGMSDLFVRIFNAVIPGRD